MYKYTHLITADQIAAQYAANDTSTRDGGTTFNSSGSFETASGSDVPPGPGYFVQFGDSYSFTCAAGTRANSISTIAGSVDYSSSGIQVTDTLGNTLLYEDAWASTVTLYAEGSSTGPITATVTFAPTASTTFSTTYHDGNGTTISATATGKTTTTGEDLFTCETTTLVPVFCLPNAAKVERYQVNRDGLPPLRAVASGFAFDVTGFATAKSLAAGTAAFLSDKFSGTSSEGTNASESYTYLTLAKLSSSQYTANFTAKRKRPTANLYSFAGSSGSAISFDAVIQNTVPFVASIASLLLVPKIFSTALISSGTSKTTTFAWRYTSGGWSLAYTTKNSVTSFTGYAGITISGTPSFTEENAVIVNGISSNILGPLLPFSSGGLNVISSTRGGTSGGNSAVYSFACSSAATSASVIWSASSSNTVSFASTYSASLLTGYVNLPGADISTEATYFCTFFEDEGVFSPSIPAISKNSKWNEAGRSDAVSVDQ